MKKRCCGEHIHARGSNMRGFRGQEVSNQPNVQLYLSVIYIIKISNLCFVGVVCFYLPCGRIAAATKIKLTSHL